MAKKTSKAKPTKKDKKKAVALRTVRAILPDSLEDQTPAAHSNVGHSGTPEPTIGPETVGSPEAGFGA